MEELYCSRAPNSFSVKLFTSLVWPNEREYNSGLGGPGSKLAWANWFFPQARKLLDTARWTSLLRGSSPHHCSPIGRAPVSLNCKNEYLVLALGEETAVQAVVGSIVWVFRSLKKTKDAENERPRLRTSLNMPQLSFHFPSHLSFFFSSIYDEASIVIYNDMATH